MTIEAGCKRGGVRANNLASVTSDPPGEDPGSQEMPSDWLVPRAPGPVRALVHLPGSKSMTNRALILAALSDRPTLITCPLVARDTMLMVNALRALGCRIEESPGAWHVEPAALRELGAAISADESASVPFVVHGRGAVAGGSVTLDASASSQFVSGLLLAAARFDSGAEIRHCGPPVPSAPHIEMTVRMLRAAGVPVTVNGAPAGVTGTAPAEHPGSASAGLPGTAPAEHPGTAPAGLTGVGELTPVLTALAALASSPSEFTGIGHLRTHESDRLAALAGEIGKLGGDVTETADGLRIRPAPLRAGGVNFDSHDDHRLVMAAAVLGLVTDGLRVHNAATVGKTFPEFGRAWARILAPAL